MGNARSSAPGGFGTWPSEVVGSTWPHTNDTTGHELLNLASDVCVLHVVVEGGWVGLGLVEDGLHHRVCQRSGSQYTRTRDSTTNETDLAKCS